MDKVEDNVFSLDEIYQDLLFERKKYRESIVWSENQLAILRRKTLRAERLAKLEKLKNV